MSIVNMNFIVTLVNAELPKLLELLESTTQEFHEVGVKHALANTHLSIALNNVAAGFISDTVVASADNQAIATQRLQCELDQHRERVVLVREVLRERVLAMTATKVGYTRVEVDAYRAALAAELAKESGSND